MFEEKVDACPSAVVPDLQNPAPLHGARLRTALAAHDDPGDPLEVDIAYGAKKRFDGKETDRHRSFPKVSDSGGRHVIFNGNPAPDVPRGYGPAVSAQEIVLHQRASLGEHLEDMMVGRFHGVEDLVDELYRNVLVKEIAHGVDENPLGPFP